MLPSILILSCGALGSSGVIRELRADGGLRLIGADSRPEHHGKYLTDTFYQVPPYTKSEYVPAIKRIIDDEKIDFIILGHTKELIILQEAGVKNILSSPPEALKITENKYLSFAAFPHISPDFRLIPSNEDNLRSAAEEMGFPDRKLCIKPVVGSGSRGFRILVDDYDQSEWMFNHKKDPHIKIRDLEKLDFPPIVLMEFLEGPVYHVDILAFKGEIRKAVVSYRTRERFGFGFCLECVDKPEYVKMAEEVVKTLNLSYNCFIQVKGDKLMEIGGRPQGSVSIGKDLILGAINLAKGLEPNTDVEKVRLIRHWDEISIPLRN